MRNPRQYTAAMLTCQAGVTAVYAVVGCVIYYYCGSYVSSPALGSAGRVMKIVSYGFALPGLLVTMTIVTHVRHADDDGRNTGNCSLLWPLDTSEIHLRPRPARFSTSQRQHPNALDCLVELYLLDNGNRLDHRQHHPRLFRFGLSYRRPTRPSHVHPTDGRYVAI
jgi:hypothetical protein